jgi:hypothetical protein
VVADAAKGGAQAGFFTDEVVAVGGDDQVHTGWHGGGRQFVQARGAVDFGLGCQAVTGRGADGADGDAGQAAQGGKYGGTEPLLAGDEDVHVARLLCILKPWTARWWPP